MIGADLVFPQQFLQAAPLARIIDDTRPTLTGAVPTVLNDLLNNAPDTDMSSLRLVMCGGSAVPRALIEGYMRHVRRADRAGLGDDRDQPGVRHRPSAEGHGGATTRSRGGCGPAASCPGVELRITDDHGDGGAVGRRVARRDRGPRPVDHRVSYYHVDDPEKFHDGWLRTGDVAVGVSRTVTCMISDRAKDVIKSGGEWVSSVDLENTLMGHPGVLEAAVIGVPDDAVGRAADGVRRAEARRRRSTADELRSVARPSAPPSSGCPSGGRSSPRCPRPASASSTRRSCAPATPPANWTSPPSPDRRQTPTLSQPTRSARPVRQSWRQRRGSVTKSARSA